MATIVGTQARITYVEEATRGLTPASPAMKTFRSTSRNINLKRDTLESAEVSTTRQRADVRLGSGRIEAPLNFELSMTTYDDWLAYLMARPNDASGAVSPADNTAATTANYNGWFQPGAASGSGVTIANVVAATSTAPGTMDFVMTNASTATNWFNLGYRPGDWVTSSGFTDTDNNGLWLIIKQTGSNCTVMLPAGATGQSTATGAAGNKVDFVGRKLSPGTTLKTMTIERGFVEGVNPLYQVFPGAAPNSMSLSIRPEAIVGGTFNLVGGLGGPGLSTVDVDNTASLDASPDAAPTNSPFAAFDGSVVTIKSDGTILSASVTQIDFTIDNQRSTTNVVGNKFSPDVYEGVCKTTGTMTLLLDSVAHLTAFQDESALNVVNIRLNELGTTDYMAFSFMRVKYLDASIDPPQNGPCLITLPFEALRQDFTGFTAGVVLSSETVRIQRSTVA